MKSLEQIAIQWLGASDKDLNNLTLISYPTPQSLNSGLTIRVFYLSECNHWIITKGTKTSVFETKHVTWENDYEEIINHLGPPFQYYLLTLKHQELLNNTNTAVAL